MSVAARLGDQASPSLSPLRVLVAEDEEVLRTALQGLLRLMGHTADVARNGREALEAAKLRSYDVVLLDVQMPEMGGFEAASRLRQDLPVRAMPRIVGLSGEPQEDGVCRAAGMDAFLPNPCDGETLPTRSREGASARRVPDCVSHLDCVPLVGRHQGDPRQRTGNGSKTSPARCRELRIPDEHFGSEVERPDRTTSRRPIHP